MLVHAPLPSPLSLPLNGQGQSKETPEQSVGLVFIAVVLLFLFLFTFIFIFTFTISDLFIAELLRGFRPPTGKFTDKLHLAGPVECSVLTLAVNSDFLEVLFVVDLTHGKIRALDERSYRQAAGIFAESLEEHRRQAGIDIEWHRAFVIVVLGNIVLGKFVRGNVVIDNAVVGDIPGDCTSC